MKVLYPNSHFQNLVIHFCRVDDEKAMRKKVRENKYQRIFFDDFEMF